MKIPPVNPELFHAHVCVGGFCSVCMCVCVGFVTCGYSGNMYTSTLRLPWLRFWPCFFLSCKANAKVKLAKTWHSPHSSKLVLICVVLLWFASFCVLFVCINVYCTAATGCQPNCGFKYISYIMTIVEGELHRLSKRQICWIFTESLLTHVKITLDLQYLVYFTFMVPCIVIYSMK